MRFFSRSKHIPGIYNYCDRWCERCAFTAKCSVFARENEANTQRDGDSRDAFLDLLQSFAETKDLLKEEAEKRGIEINEPTNEEMESFREEEKRKNEVIQQDPLIIAARTYSSKGQDVFDNREWAKSNLGQLQQQVDLGIRTGEDAMDALKQLEDAWAIVQWDVHQVYVKLMRAMSCLAEANGKDKSLMNDANGSTKVALLAIDRSMDAWQKIFNAMPEAEDDILPLLSLLQQTRQLAEQQFPKARAFRRPGFDD